MNKQGDPSTNSCHTI